MDNLLPQFEPFKNKIPQFIIKLYHILQLNQYSQYLSWSGDSDILIKNPKKLQQKVLPHFFRHRHLSSFIRQLNMYKFNKVVKLVKQRNYMYFRNDDFKRGQIKQLLKIKRNIKKNRQQSLSELSEEQKIEKISIEQNIPIKSQQSNFQLGSYKHYVKQTVGEIALLLKKIENNFPEIKQQITPSLIRCNQILQIPTELSHESLLDLQDSHPQTNKLQASLQNMFYPSNCYLEN